MSLFTSVIIYYFNGDIKPIYELFREALYGYTYSSYTYYHYHKIVSDFLGLSSFTTIAICIISSITISVAINEIYKAIIMSVYKQKHINQ